MFVLETGRGRDPFLAQRRGRLPRAETDRRRLPGAASGRCGQLNARSQTVWTSQKNCNNLRKPYSSPTCGETRALFRRSYVGNSASSGVPDESMIARESSIFLG